MHAGPRPRCGRLHSCAGRRDAAPGRVRWHALCISAVFGTRVPARPGTPHRADSSRRGRHVASALPPPSPSPRSRHRRRARSPSSCSRSPRGDLPGDAQGDPREVRAARRGDRARRCAARSGSCSCPPTTTRAPGSASRSSTSRSCIRPMSRSPKSRPGATRRWSGRPASPSTRCRCSSSPIRR